MTSLNKDTVESKCLISNAAIEIVCKFGYSRKKKQLTKQFSSVLELLIKEKKISFKLIRERFGYTSNVTFLKYMNALKKLNLCRRKRDQQTDEIYYYFVQNKNLRAILFLLRSEFRCPVLLKKKHASMIKDEIKEYLKSLRSQETVKSCSKCG